MGQRNKEAQIEEFDLWLKTKFTESFWMGGHRFEKTRTGDIQIDKAPFSAEEARQLFLMLSSRNPITRLSATLVIWDRNGTLIKALLIAAFLLLILVFILINK
jgi:hypothetical protein